MNNTQTTLSNLRSILDTITMQIRYGQPIETSVADAQLKLDVLAYNYRSERKTDRIEKKTTQST